MGSNFFRSMWEGPAAFIGSQSTLGKAIYNDPINRATGHMIVQPNGNYGMKAPPGQPSAYSGVAPTLAAANAGYPQPGTPGYANMMGTQSNPSAPKAGQRPMLPAWGGW